MMAFYSMQWLGPIESGQPVILCSTNPMTGMETGPSCQLGNLQFQFRYPFYYFGLNSGGRIGKKSSGGRVWAVEPAQFIYGQYFYKPTRY